MALAFGGLTFKLLPDNTIEVNFDGNKTNLNYKDTKELMAWLSNNEMQYGASATPVAELGYNIAQDAGMNAVGRRYR